jgi:organic radical activating enzyme
MYSIITTFGCIKHCSYCISKKIGLANNSLFYNKSVWIKSVLNNIDQTFSISGGGDPFFNFNHHQRFWEFMDYLAYLKNCYYDIHTAITEYPNRSNFKRLRKIILHLDPNNLDRKYNADRVVMVLDDLVTKDHMKRFEELYKDIQVSYRQIVYENKPKLNIDLYARTIKLRNPKGRYIKQKDYNTYIWPDGTIKKEFK